MSTGVKSAINQARLGTVESWSAESGWSIRIASRGRQLERARELRRGAKDEIEQSSSVLVAVYSPRHVLRISYFGSDSRPIFPPISAEMLKSNFIVRERVRNAKILKKTNSY